MMTMDDMLAIVKPHNDKIIAEGRLAEAERQIERLREIIREMGKNHDVCTFFDLNEVCSDCRCKWKAERLAKTGAVIKL